MKFERQKYEIGLISKQITHVEIFEPEIKVQRLYAFYWYDDLKFWRFYLKLNLV